MVSEQDVSYVADLAHLELTPEERTRMLKDLNSILAYVERLNQLDTSNVEPMAQVANRYGVSKDAIPGEAFAYAMRPPTPHTRFQILRKKPRAEEPK